MEEGMCKLFIFKNLMIDLSVPMVQDNNLHNYKLNASY